MINCTAGGASLDALRLAGEGNLSGKLLIDVANSLNFSRGMSPTLSICNTESLAELIQFEFANVRVVKTLNTVNAQVMVNPSMVPGEHDMFLCGNDPGAKTQVATILRDWFGWRTVIDHTSLRYFFESTLSPNTFWVEMRNLDFTEGAPTKRLNLGEGETTVYAGDASAQFEQAEPFTFLGAT